MGIYKCQILFNGFSYTSLDDFLSAHTQIQEYFKSGVDFVYFLRLTTKPVAHKVFKGQPYCNYLYNITDYNSERIFVVQSRFEAKLLRDTINKQPKMTNPLGKIKVCSHCGYNEPPID